MTDKITEAEAMIEELERAQEWMREPDYAENFSLVDMATWINARPLTLFRRCAESLRSAKAREEAPTPAAANKPMIYLVDQLNGVVIGGKKHGWIVWLNGAGLWETVQKADVRDPLERIPEIFKTAPSAGGEHD